MITVTLPEWLVYIFTITITISVALDVYRIYLDKEVERANRLASDE